MLFGSFLNSGLSIEDVTIEILRFHGFKLKLDNTTIKEYIEAIVLHLCKREFHRKKNPGTYDSSFEKDITKVKFEYLQYLNLLEKLKSDSEKYFSNTQLDFFKKSNLMKEYELEILNKYILDAKKK